MFLVNTFGFFIKKKLRDIFYPKNKKKQNFRRKRAIFKKSLCQTGIIHTVATFKINQELLGN